MQRVITGTVLVALLLGFYLFYIYGRAYWHPLVVKVAGARSIPDVIARYGDDARQRMKPYFKTAKITYPPKSVTFLAVKDEASLELWDTSGSEPVFVHQYPIEALSGVSGPKLREGDRQVPEGVYSIEYLNPNSSYHLSMKLNYPNAFDLKHAKAEGRDQPGTNIFIHGKAVSIGCLAMGDEAVEELFTLANDIGHQNIEVAIAPSDPRKAALQPIKHLAWSKILYSDLMDYFLPFSH
ncbi:L,D-transpeptidase family protein [Kangiella shandongensis]|uniref:L,D-transpeptidase family protein n=1 Tax=Kangiella shandongensis TaxID=2763258 RepID=UPI001CBD10FC|nr:L,D-transpeptidase family protein [Kangiella shandongensis]